jgi:hypothetical protein
VSTSCRWVVTGRWPSGWASWGLGSAARPRPPPLQGGPLLVGETTPDAVLLIGVHREFEAGLRYGAPLAHRFGARLASLLLEL